MHSPLTPSLIELVYLSDETYPRDMSSEITGDTYVLCAPLRRGRATIESDGQLLHDGEVKPGMLRITAPGERVRARVNSPSYAALLTIPGTQLRQIADAEGSGHRDTAHIHPLLRPDERVARISAMLLSATEFDPRQRQLFVDGLAHSLLAFLLENHGRVTDTPVPRRSHGLSDAEFERCVEYADTMLAKGLDLTSWAEVLGMTTAEFARRFQIKTQQAPYAWFLNWRIDRAKQLLHDSRVTLADVAFQVGFCSQSHFSEAFRRRAGMTPGRWRTQRMAS